MFVYYADFQDMTNLYFPFFKNLIINLGWFYSFFNLCNNWIIKCGKSIDWSRWFSYSTRNIGSCVFAFISYVTGNIVFSNYLQIPYIEGTGEISIFCGAIIGSCLGFLWFNAPPAKIFMGDTGILSLGGSLGTIGIITKHEIVLAITGGLFVLEAVSVMVQVISFKLTGKEFLKWHQFTIILKKRMARIDSCHKILDYFNNLAMIGLATLKLR